MNPEQEWTAHDSREFIDKANRDRATRERKQPSLVAEPQGISLGDSYEPDPTIKAPEYEWLTEGYKPMEPLTFTKLRKLNKLVTYRRDNNLI